MGFFDRFKRTEDRASSFTQLVVQQLAAGADGTVTSTAGLAVLEIAAGLYGRAFTVAEVTPQSASTRGLTPSVLEIIGRELISSGELVLVPEFGPSGMELLPASDWYVTGGPNPSSWRYRVTVPGPTTLSTRILPAAGVVHFMYGRSPIQPWKGIGPLDRARSTGTIAANLEKRLGEEVGGRSGNLLPVPGDPGSTTFDGLRADLSSLKGNTAMVPSLAGGFEQGQAGGRGQEWKPIRFGADPPSGLDVIRSSAGRAVLSACGVPIPLADSSKVPSQALREALRQFLHLSVAPLAELVAHELRTKLDVPELSLKFRRLHAADIMGRARAFGSLVNAVSGETPAIDPERAARIAGLED